MKNQFFHVLEETERNNWCVQPYCTTCGNHAFRSAVTSIPNLQKDLELINLDKLTTNKNWCDALRVTAIDYRFSINWTDILSLWLPYAEDHIDFADYVFYYLVAHVPCNQQTYTAWLDTCIYIALQTKHASLIESLVRTLGGKVSAYGDLIAVALKEASHSECLKNALNKAGIIPSREEIQQKQAKERMRIHASYHLFGAIRRNDTLAVRALIDKGAVLMVKNEEGKTPMEYAQSLLRTNLIPLLEFTDTQLEEQ